MHPRWRTPRRNTPTQSTHVTVPRVQADEPRIASSVSRRDAPGLGPSHIHMSLAHSGVRHPAHDATVTATRLGSTQNTTGRVLRIKRLRLYLVFTLLRSFSLLIPLGKKLRVSIIRH